MPFDLSLMAMRSIVSATVECLHYDNCEYFDAVTAIRAEVGPESTSILNLFYLYLKLFGEREISIQNKYHLKVHKWRKHAHTIDRMSERTNGPTNLMTWSDNDPIGRPVDSFGHFCLSVSLRLLWYFGQPVFNSPFIRITDLLYNTHTRIQ